MNLYNKDNPYDNFEQIDLELKKLDLRRKIAFEELKLIKSDLKEDLQPFQWLQTFAKYTGRFGMMYFIRKIFR